MSKESETLSLQQDAQARAAALDVGRSFLLQAPAGSGKTTVLTARLLALLAQVDEPEEILAITFTRKAAAEMRERVLGALRTARDSASALAPEEQLGVLAATALRRDRVRGWGLLDSPTRLHVQTIDSFCQSLASQLPVAARTGLRMELALPATPLYTAAARRVLERALADDGLCGLVQRLFTRLDNDWSRLESLLVTMLEERAHWLPRVLGAEPGELALRVEASVRALLREKFAQAENLLPAALRRQGEELAVHAARNLAASGVVDPGVSAWASDELLRWRFLCALALTKAGEWRRSWSKLQGFVPADKALKVQLSEWVAALAAIGGAQELCNELLELPDAALPAEDASALVALSTLLTHAAAELQLEFAARGQVDFPAVAAAARVALTENGAPTDLALRLGHAIRHILIDEFQDTSLDQFQLLSALTAGWESGDGRTLFAVGDPMQSIYQFREAEVGLFLRARDRGIGALRLESLQLRRNFRAAPNIVDWVNAACGRIFPAEDDVRLAAIRYLPALAAAPRTGGVVKVHPQSSQDPQLEAAQVVQIVQSTRAGGERARVAVLVQTRRHAAPIAAALQSAGISVRGVNLEPLSTRPVVRDLSVLARALQHLGDRTAWLALLHGPCVALTLAELQTLCADQPETIWEGITAGDPGSPLSAPSRQRLARAHSALAPVLQGGERSLPLWQRVDRAWLRLGGPAAYPEARDVADAQVFVQALAARRDAEALCGEALEAFCADLFSAQAPDPDAVEILTLHGAKGLEWDVVIVPGLGKSGRGEVDPLLHWLDLPSGEGGSDLLLAPVDDAASAPERSVATYIKRLRRQRLRLERARLLYVAATRARYELHWLGYAAPDTQGAVRPRGGTLLALLWPVVGGEFAAHGSASSAASALSGAAIAAPSAGPAATAVLSARQRLRSDWQPRGLPAAVRVDGLQTSQREMGGAPVYDWVGLGARAVGTIVHAELQRLAGLELLPTNADLAPSRYEGWLAELGVPEAQRAAAGERIVLALTRTLADARGRWLLQGADAHSELRLTGLHEGRVVNIIVDRVLLDEQGDRWIIDYKSSTHEGSDLDGFLASETERYRPQLQRYVALLRQAYAERGAGADADAGDGGGDGGGGGGGGGARWRAALYFPLLGEFREVAIES